MKGTWKSAAGILTAVVTVFMSACGPGQRTAAAAGATSIASKTATQSLYVDKVLTKEQMLSDYDSMWDAMQENYPFFGVLAREHPENPDYFYDVIEDYRQQIKNMEAVGDASMWEYILIISGSLYDVCGIKGHVGILNPHYFREMDMYKQMVGEMPVLQPWVGVINKPEVSEFYEYYDYLLTLLPKPEDSTNAQSEEEADQSVAESVAEKKMGQTDGTIFYSDDHLILKTIPAKKAVAYIKADSFENSLMAVDLPRIQSFKDGYGY